MRVQRITTDKANVIYNTHFGNNKQGNATIDAALDELKKIKFEQNDLIYAQSIGAKVPFKNGMEAYEFIQNNNIPIRYAKLTPNDVHAAWDSNTREILINEKYKNSTSFPEILAISEAIFHETGHGKDDNGDSSIQEELDCLALNALAHRFHKKTYKDVFVNQNSFLFVEGVSLYEKLFYEFDTKKENLKKRISDKYGFLPAGSAYRPASKFSVDVKKINYPN